MDPKNVTHAQFLNEYIKELEKDENHRFHPPDVVADKMLWAINTGGKSAWLPYNPALKRAAKSFRITTDKLLREVVKSWGLVPTIENP